MILPIIRTAFAALRRDRAALVLSFVLPIAFFSIFAVVFGGPQGSTSRVSLLFADEDHSDASRQLLQGLRQEGALNVLIRPAAAKGVPPAPEYTAATAEAAVKAGDASVALVVPRGWGLHPVAFGPGAAGPALQLLKDSSDPIAPQVVAGLLQKVAMTAMPEALMTQGMQYAARYLGALTPGQRANMQAALARLRQLRANPAGGAGAGAGFNPGGIVALTTRDVVGQSKRNPMISFYAAAIGVMFLLFTASGAAGSLLEEAESGTLDRVLSSRITMTTLLAGKLAFNALLAFSQLVLMFLWAWAVFKVDLFSHLPGFVVMGVCTALPVAAFGMVLASLCQTRAQLGALSTLLILIMSSIGGSMFPRFLMPPAVQNAGLFTINAWAIDGFTKVFWRDQPVGALWPQVAVLLSIAVVLFALARRFARRWEFN